MVAGYAFVARICGVYEVARADFRRAVGFLDGDEIDPVVVLEAMPEMVVDAGLVPRINDFPALGRAVAQGFRCGAFDDGDVMGLLFPGVRLAQSDVSEVVAAQVEPEEVAGGDPSSPRLGSWLAACW